MAVTVMATATSHRTIAVPAAAGPLRRFIRMREAERPSSGRGLRVRGADGRYKAKRSELSGFPGSVPVSSSSGLTASLPACI
jgi:hypothetical protein